MNRNLNKQQQRFKLISVVCKLVKVVGVVLGEVVEEVVEEVVAEVEVDGVEEVVEEVVPEEVEEEEEAVLRYWPTILLKKQWTNNRSLNTLNRPLVTSLFQQ